MSEEDSLEGKSKTGTSDDVKESFMSSDVGLIFLFGLSVALLIVGGAHIYKGWTAGFKKYMRFNKKIERFAIWVCQFGLIARGIVWCVVAIFLAHSAVLTQRGELKNVEDALQSLSNNSYGVYILIVVTIGLFSFGVYGLLEAKYRKIKISTDF